MADIVDKSLDDIIKERHIRAGRRGGGVGQRGTGRGGFGQRRGAGRGGPRLNRSANGGASANGGGLRRSGGIQKRRSGGFAGSPGKAAAIGGDWNHDLYQGGGRRSAPGTSAGAATALVTTGPAKLVISNLDFGVSDSDIKGLFQEFGNIRKAAVHYDRSGRSLGTADVVFERRADGIKALRKYNGVSLDGRPMNIQLTAQLVAAEPAPVQRTQRSNNGGGFQPRRQNNGGGGGFQPRRGGASNGGGGRGGRGGRSQQQSKSAAELDAELETYTAKMQTD